MKKIFLGFPILVVLLSFSCSTEGAMQQILGTNAQAPVFLYCRPVSSTEVVFMFSRPVRVTSLNFDPVYEARVIEEGREVKVAFINPPPEGRKITADILVEDSGRNSLNVIAPFRARNDRMPVLVFNELRLDYSRPRIEFIEFITLGEGNLGAMRLFIAHQSLSEPVYEFPPAEVKAGEYVVLHLRTLEEASADETGDNLSLSGGDGAHSDARDFWIPGSTKLLHKTNGLWLMDQDDRILDALLLSENPAADSGNKTFMAAAEFLSQRSGWTLDPAEAAFTRGTTATRTLCRDETVPAAPGGGNWYVTVTSGNTPGRPNNTGRFNQ